jgi:two-component system, NtrC family, response regulator
MREGKFPDDLFFAFVIVAIPPLRDRTEDILPLAQAFLRKFADENGKRLTAFLVSAEDAMMTYSWPGNVRELENRVRRAVVMAEGLRIRPDDLELSETCSPHQPHRPTLKEAREALEREMITAALARWKGNVTRAAEELDVSRPTLYELMVKLGMPRS